ncbi:ion transporter [Salinisphaera sp.]|uniref:ion transporter n=1 Tax=Salinisphaera sp. TaxID=1914330 RepID=UPI002D793B90|nr:ion transporter [Salinisphaera sp.]HET7313886.1 ion transporter [Salinisphaera sp.]
MSRGARAGRRAMPDPLAVVSGDRTLGERLLLAWDLAIIVLVSLNLALIVFDTLYAIGPVGDAFGALWPSAHDGYAQAVHAQFTTIDLAFVAVFVLDVLAGWALAIAQHRYYRWYFYPFVRWYDVLGCIPVAGFRFLRVLRVISIMMRLQRLGVIDVRGWWLYRQFMVYYDIVVEEISDRVVIKVLSGVQEEMKSGGQRLSRRIVADVVAPRRQGLTSAAGAQIEHSVVAAYQANREQIQTYVGRIVTRAVDANPALGNLERVPMLGAYVSRALDEAIRDTVNQVLDEAVAGLSSTEFDALVSNVVEAAIERLLAQDMGAASTEIRDATIEVLELVKEQVAVQRWRERFE